MKAFAIAAVILSFAASAHGQEGPYFPDASETTPELIELWQEANGTCRGNSGNDVKTWAACASRAVYGTALNERNQCLGKQDQANAEMQWHECEADSLRFPAIDIGQF